MSPDDAWADYLGARHDRRGVGPLRRDLAPGAARLLGERHPGTPSRPARRASRGSRLASEGVASRSTVPTSSDGPIWWNCSSRSSRGTTRRSASARTRTCRTPSAACAPCSRCCGSMVSATWRASPVGAWSWSRCPLAHKLQGVKRYHVTTFGCQMNVHDSERIKGLLESLGLGEAATPGRGRRGRVQHLHDPREGRRALRHAPDAGACGQGAASRARDRRRRLLVGVDEGRAVRALPVRRPGVRARQHLAARRLHRGGRRAAARALLDVRRVRGRPARAPRPTAPGVGADLDGLQLDLLVLHRAVRARPRAVAVARHPRVRGRGARAATACARSRCSARTSTRGGATCRSPSGSASAGCCAGSTPCPASSASATRARTRRTCATTSSPRIASAPRSASTSTCPCSRARRASCARCAAPTRASATSPWPSACATRFRASR